MSLIRFTFGTFHYLWIHSIIYQFICNFFFSVSPVLLDIWFVFFRPGIDTRQETVQSRCFDKSKSYINASQYLILHSFDFPLPTPGMGFWARDVPRWILKQRTHSLMNLRSIWVVKTVSSLRISIPSKRELIKLPESPVFLIALVGLELNKVTHLGLTIQCPT